MNKSVICSVIPPFFAKRHAQLSCSLVNAFATFRYRYHLFARKVPSAHKYLNCSALPHIKPHKHCVCGVYAFFMLILIQLFDHNFDHNNKKTSNISNCFQFNFSRQISLFFFLHHKNLKIFKKTLDKLKICVIIK